jgi:predicted DNA-binding transcriptional regulator AlpA
VNATASAVMAQPLLVDAPGVCATLGIGLTLFHTLRNTGRFGPSPVRLGRAVRFRSDEVAAWVAAGAPSLERWRAMTGGGSR